MTAQRGLFDEPLPQHCLPLHAPDPRTLARKTDPVSSHSAAAEHVASGDARAQAEMVLDLLYMQPNSTTHELAELSKRVHNAIALDAVQIGKRLPHISEAHAGAVRKCRVTRRKCQAWRIA